MKIGIVGAGFIGATLARKLAAAGHQVQIANSRTPSTLAEFEGENGITPVWAAEAVQNPEMVILSLPQKAVENLPDNVLSALKPVRIVIDTGNYYPVRDGRIDGIEGGLADSEWVATCLGRPVFKVFNNIAAPSLKHRGTTNPGQRLGLTVAGPAAEDKQKVFDLVRQLGFDPVDAGALEHSWRLQPGTPTFCKNMTADQFLAGLAETIPEDTGKYHELRDQLRDFEAAQNNMRQRM